MDKNKGLQVSNENLLGADFMANEKRLKDKLVYWNSYYENHLPKDGTQSKFAEFVLSKIEKGKDMIELGCGNGRDSLFFIKNGINMTAVDSSSSAIELLNKFCKSENSQFVCDDFIKTDLLADKKYDYCYSRFTWHSITVEQEDELLERLKTALKPGGKLFIEARSIHDDIYGMGVEVAKDTFYYDEHCRRFLRIEELTNKIKSCGYDIEYSEEKKGFAPFKESDPIIIRIICINK